MRNLDSLFVNFETALALQKLGYNERDFGYYRLSLEEEKEPFTATELGFFRERYDNHNFRLQFHKCGDAICTAPTIQQAFTFFQENKVPISTEYHQFDSKPVYSVKWHNGLCQNEYRTTELLKAINKAIEKFPVAF